MWRNPEFRTRQTKVGLSIARQFWGWEPHESQRAFLLDPAQIKVAACGRRWGKTEALAVDIAALAIEHVGCRQLIVAPTDNQARYLGRMVAGLLQRLPKGGWGRYDELRSTTVKVRQRPYLCIEVTRPYDAAHKDACRVSVIHCRTAGRDGAALRGQAADRIIVDEAARVPDCVLTEVLQPMLLDSGGEMILASTPQGRRSEFFRLFAKCMSQASAAAGQPAPALSHAAFQCPTRDNPHLDHGLLEAERESLTEDAYAAEYEAQFLEDYGCVFREEDIANGIASDAAVTQQHGHLLAEPVEGHRYTVGIDWGRKHDFTVLAVVDSTPTPARLVHLERYQGTSWETQVRTAAATIVRFAPRRVLADGNSIGDAVIENLQATLQKTAVESRAATIERFSFGAESKRNLIDTLNLALSARTLTYPPHKTLLSELRGFEYGDTPGGRVRMGARPGAHDDCVTALALACYAAPAAASCAPTDYERLFAFGVQQRIGGSLYGSA